MKNIFAIEDKDGLRFDVYSNKLVLFEEICKPFTDHKQHKGELVFKIQKPKGKVNERYPLDYNDLTFTYPRLLALCSRFESILENIQFSVFGIPKKNVEHKLLTVKQLHIISKN